MKTTNQQKYENHNPVQSYLIRHFQSKLINLLRPLHPASILEAGCGEGFLLQQLTTAMPGITMLGVDINEQAIAKGRRLFPALSLAYGDVFQLDQLDATWDVVIASEVLEHLSMPIAALREFRRVSKQWLLLTVPNEPWFRLGNMAWGRHLRAWGNHPEHINQWSAGQFAALVGGIVKVERIVESFPWTIVLAHR